MTTAADVDRLYAEIAEHGPRLPMMFSEEMFARTHNEDGRAIVRDYLDEYKRRQRFIARFGWAVPSRPVIQRIAAFVGDRPVLEVFAGSGLWATLLSAEGVDVLATDGGAATEGMGRPGPLDRPAPIGSNGPVEIIDAVSAVRAHPERTALMLVWPTLGATAAAEALEAFSGDRLVYVGEWDGCAAEPGLFRAIRRGWLWHSHEIPTWNPGGLPINDRLYLATRRAPAR